MKGASRVESGRGAETGCEGVWQQDIEEARAVAGQPGTEFRVINLMLDDRSRVVDYLLDGYCGGLTPNPDVMCNREIKFGIFPAGHRPKSEASPVSRKPSGIVEKRPDKKEIVVAFDAPATPRLDAPSCRIGSVSFVNHPVTEAGRVQAMPRYRSKAVPATIELLEGGKHHLKYRVAQRALAPGQVCAFSGGDVLLEGGLFAEIFNAP